MNPSFPLYIVSKGRWDSRLTSKALEGMGVPYYLVIEQQEYDKYAAEVSEERLLVLDPKFQTDYDTFDDLGDTKSKGPGAARNFAWQHAIDNGFDWHWVMDDNIDGFYRLNQNLKVRVSDGTVFKCMEDFILRYQNVGMAGPNYCMFAPRKKIQPPYVCNTRIYSCNFIRNDLPYRWRGRYNEDTDISLRMLKDGWCTVQFNAFLQMKTPTQVLRGGNSEEFYDKEGTLPKSRMQVKMHPDVSTLVWRFGRWHHHVDYRPFRKLKMVKREGIEIPDGVNNYGMELKQIEGEA